MNFLDKLIIAVKDLDNISIIQDNLKEKTIEKACINYLKSLNYKVVSRPSIYKIKDLDDLVTTFYSLVEYTQTSVCAMTANKDKDRALLSTFVKGRQIALDIEYSSALQETALIMHGLFNYKDELGLTVPLGIWVFGSAKYRWVIDKVIFLLNTEEDALNDFAVGKLIELDEAISDEYTGFDFEHLRSIHG